MLNLNIQTVISHYAPYKLLGSSTLKVSNSEIDIASDIRRFQNTFRFSLANCLVLYVINVFFSDVINFLLIVAQFEVHHCVASAKYR